MKTDWAPKQRREREYWRSLRLWFKHFMEYLTSSNIADPSQIIPELDAYCQAQGEFAYRAASNMITALFSDGKRSWREAARESMMGPQFYRALQDELQGRVGIRLQELITENAQLISTFSQISAGGVTLAEQVNNFIEEESLKGRRAKDIADDLREQFPDVAESRIALIARTEVSKSATALTRARSEELGLNFYTWQTSQDARVRESHRFMGRDGGVLVNWNDPPSPEELIGIKSALGHYHSGDCPNCRCYPAPLLRLDEIAWPHRVYIGGRVQTMTRGGLRDWGEDMDNNPHKIRIQDLTGLGPWLEKQGITIDLEREETGRVVGFAPATPEVYRLMAEYQSGPTVDLLNFLSFQRRLRGRFLDLRGDINGHRRNGRNGKAVPT